MMRVATIAEEANMATYKLLSKKLFGEASRYALFSAIDRFGDPSFIIEDAERVDERTGLPAVIFQSADEAETNAKVEALSTVSEWA